MTSLTNSIECRKVVNTSSLDKSFLESGATTDRNIVILANILKLLKGQTAFMFDEVDYTDRH